MTLVKKPKPKVRTVEPDKPFSKFDDWIQYIHRKVEEGRRNGTHLYQSIKN